MMCAPAVSHDEGHAWMAKLTHQSSRLATGSLFAFAGKASSLKLEPNLQNVCMPQGIGEIS